MRMAPTLVAYAPAGAGIPGNLQIPLAVPS
jgi:hypothetical protein